VTYFDINLATRPFRNNAIHWIVLGASVVILLGFTWYQIHDYRSTTTELAEWTERIEARRAALDDLAAEVAGMDREIARINLPALSARSDFANAIIMGRLFSWSTLFERLEALLPATVRLRSIRPAIAREGIEISVDGATRDYGSLLDFEEALLESTYFALVYPLQESSRKREGEIQFNLAFAYMPGGMAPPVVEEPPPPEEETLSLDGILEEEYDDEYAPGEADETGEDLPDAAGGDPPGGTDRTASEAEIPGGSAAEEQR